MRALGGVAARRDSPAGFLLSAWTLAALAAAAALLPPIVTIVGFAFVSAAALREFRAPRWLFLLLPLQYGFVAAGAWPLATLALPLVATLAIPLVSVLARDTRDLAARTARQCWGVMLAGYALSHAPALLVLDRSGMALPSDPLTAGLAVSLVGAGAALGRYVAIRMGLPALGWVSAVAFSAPLAFHLVRLDY